MFQGLEHILHEDVQLRLAANITKKKKKTSCEGDSPVINDSGKAIQILSEFKNSQGTHSKMLISVLRSPQIHRLIRPPRQFIDGAMSHVVRTHTIALIEPAVRFVVKL